MRAARYCGIGVIHASTCTAGATRQRFALIPGTSTARYGRVMAPNMTSTAEHLRNALDGRWRDVKNQTRARFEHEQFRPHYTPNTVIARAKVAEQMKIIAGGGHLRRRVPQGARRHRRRRCGDHDDRDAGDVGSVADGQGRSAMGPVRRCRREPGHRTPLEAYVKKIITLELRGCFAMTETGHGSDVQSLETTATYDAETEEFVIDSPTPTARKDYIGGAAETATIAAVFAQLITTEDGKPVNHGVHCVLVPIRDADGNDLPGVTTSDCHYKGGLPGVDNGRIMFDHVRVPRVNLLNKYGDVAPDGTYSSPIDNPNRRFFTMIGTLIRGRVTVGGSAGAATQRGTGHRHPICVAAQAIQLTRRRLKC